VLWVTRNRLRLGNGTGPAARGITVTGSARLKLAGNRLSGEAGAGIEVDVANGCLVLGNSFQGLETAAGPDLLLGSETSDCLAIVGRHDLVRDEGSNNRVIRR
jgi:parallel beta-helix repeat protein